MMLANTKTRFRNNIWKVIVRFLESHLILICNPRNHSIKTVLKTTESTSGTRVKRW